MRLLEKLILFSLLFTPRLHAQSEGGDTIPVDSARGEPQLSPEELSKKRTSRINRSFHKAEVFANYSYIDLLIPSKTGVTAAFREDENISYELEYMRGSIKIPFVVKDLGSFTEQRLVLSRRTFWETNSFSLYGSAVYNKMEIRLGNEYLSTLSPESIPIYEVMSVSTLGLGGGLGNRWQLDCGFAFGVDWFAWYQPLTIIKSDAPSVDAIKNDDTRQGVEKALNAAAHFPRFVILKFQAGWAF